ncbi:hypothetical protein [Streptomyces sp. SLBN-8D4]|uniref:hypothetical protein n=1 Tax=Streptomyces sp. SLBN-8D4 TaxID=3377728 RepID=UPI003C7E9BC0
MENIRIEAFFGMDSRPYELIREGRLEEYRQAAYELRSAWHSTREAGQKWNGPISFRDDGTVMALSILPIRKRRPF